MATAAQIEANRRNSQKSCGPRTQAGKDKSGFTALDHGCRANILVLPTEEFGDYENQCEAWKLSFKPRNPAEEFLIERIVSLGCLTMRIDQTETARLSKRISYGVFEEQAKVDEEVIELGQNLFQDACGPRSLHLQDQARAPETDGELRRVSDYSNAEDQPTHLIRRLKTTGAGCEWLLDRWTQLRELLDQGMPWLAPDKPEGERLRRYRLTCSRTRSRMFDLLLKLRTTADALDIATVASIRRSVPTVMTDAIDQSRPFVADDNNTLLDEPALEPDPPIEEPVPPNEANLAPENAPNEPNSHVQATSPEHRDAKEVRIDTPHVELIAGGRGITRKETNQPAFERVMRGRKPLLNPSPIFGEQ